MARAAKIVKFWQFGPAVVALFVLSNALMAAPALAQVCACKKTASGICQRWLKPEIPWSLYLGSGKGIITDDALEKASVQAFAAWANVSCKLCMKPDAATETCKAVECDANPLGIVPKYMGRATEPMLASSCNGVYCPAAAPGTSQIAIIRDAAQWPLSTGVITAPILTVTKQGEIIDADVLFFDNGKSWCVDKCLPNQYPLGGALLQEVGHFLGVGFSQQTLSVLAANFSDNGTNLLPTLGIDDTQCVCQIYRAASSITQCEIKIERTSDSCTARPSQTTASQGPRGAPAHALTILAVALVALLWRRQRLSGRDL